MRFISLIAAIMIIFLIKSTLDAQTCTGNKGVNIFTDGDFGSGTNPVLLTNPNIAPGYIYTTGLPDDGYYSIVSNTGVWTLYPSWLSIKDNSPDPNGYMMVVNASFSPGIFYEKNIDDICGNTLYEFSADVINLIKSGTPNHSDPVVDFLIDGVVRFSTGQIPKNERWNTFGFTFVSPENAGSVRLTLRNNAPGGNGNDLALDNIIFRPCGPSAFIDIDPDKAIILCSDDDPFPIQAQIAGSTNPSIIWQISEDRVNWMDYGVKNVPGILHENFAVGTYYYRYLTAGDDMAILNEKCRIISDEVTIVVLPLEYYITDSICSAQFYQLGDQLLNVSGNYEALLNSSKGCDSTVFLDLKVIDPAVVFERYDEICNQGISITQINFPGSYRFVINDILNDVIIEDLPFSIQLKEDSLHSVMVSNESGCSETFEVFIENNDDVSVTLDSVAISQNIYSLTVIADTEISSLNWATSDGMECINCNDLTLKITQDVEVNVSIDFENGCQRDLKLWLSFRPLVELIMPNIFSPNGDGINDYFFVQYADQNINIKEMFIYDRWGTKLFELQNGKVNIESEGWDGTFNRFKVAQGVYLYYLILEDILGNKITEKSGSVLLIR